MVAPHHDSIAYKMKSEAESKRHALIAKAVEDADIVLAAEASRDANLKSELSAIQSDMKPLSQIDEILSEISDRTKTMLLDIDKALKEVGDAQTWETLDMFGSNPAFSLLSHGETREAIEHINRVSRNFSDYQEFIAQKGKDLPAQKTDTQDIENIAEWDLWMGVFDVDVISFFTSWRNHERLEEAKGQLKKLRGSVNEIYSNVQSQLTENDSKRTEIKQRYDALVEKTLNETQDLPELMRAYQSSAQETDYVRKSLQKPFMMPNFS